VASERRWGMEEEEEEEEEEEATNWKNQIVVSSFASC
jgi:hypothetical protein